uniref:Putative LAGLIDADG homing endonuclease n=1 Tax=Hafniomonas laevis TaxID=436124 RepID=A0A0S2LNU3_9CHLO|nr:putative LAGLIDADG homing endonuclease [Hafniomonas laevis]YP_009185016.1 putative LAGLIDADG homing endonuclease [Hafniomonas laevis]ALO63088.1 putative LAGLIDADG homing endonuclease [Hafniomonas laevis]ALO63093.1 putative LAGLIDADG homing endonuclease [Hafniomonas laevis]
MIIKTKRFIYYLFMNYNIKTSDLENDWIVGFVDGDGCFHVGKDNVCSFVVAQDKDSVSTLYALKTHFKCGSVNFTSGHMMEYRVKAKGELKEIVIPFFVKNPLQTKKFMILRNFTM